LKFESYQAALSVPTLDPDPSTTGTGIHEMRPLKGDFLPPLRPMPRLENLH